jgi:hypothetical protein
MRGIESYFVISPSCSDDGKKTFKPKKNHNKGTSEFICLIHPSFTHLTCTVIQSAERFDLHNKTYATLGSGDVKAAVMLPPGEDLNEWLAMNSKISKQPK